MARPFLFFGEGRIAIFVTLPIEVLNDCILDDHQQV
jgi:hypothetical protein